MKKGIKIYRKKRKKIKNNNKSTNSAEYEPMHYKMISSDLDDTTETSDNGNISSPSDSDEDDEPTPIPSHNRRGTQCFLHPSHTHLTTSNPCTLFLNQNMAIQTDSAKKAPNTPPSPKERIFLLNTKKYLHNQERKSTYTHQGDGLHHERRDTLLHHDDGSHPERKDTHFHHGDGSNHERKDTHSLHGDESQHPRCTVMCQKCIVHQKPGEFLNTSLNGTPKEPQTLYEKMETLSHHSNSDLRDSDMNRYPWHPPTKWNPLKSEGATHKINKNRLKDKKNLNKWWTEFIIQENDTDSLRSNTSYENSFENFLYHKGINPDGDLNSETDSIDSDDNDSDGSPSNKEREDTKNTMGVIYQEYNNKQNEKN